MLTVRDKSGNGMGIGFVNRAKVEGRLQGIGRSDATFVLGEFNAALSNTFVATVRLERSYDGGASWHRLTALGTAFQFTGPCEETFEEQEPGVLYSWYCSAYTSGNIDYRISQ